MSIRASTLETRRGSFGIRRSTAPAGTPVICLHGFPDDATTFDDLSTTLVGDGYDVVAMYLRGYHPSVLDGPYDIDQFVEDLIAVLDELGWTEPVHLIGHDYGAQISFAATTEHPDRFRSAVALAGAHPTAIARNTRRHPRQIWLSRYIIFFQLGTIADRKVAADSFAYVDTLWRRWSPTAMPDARHLDRVKTTLEKSMPAPVAMYRGGGFTIGAAPISVPTLFIAGTNDGCILPTMSDGQETLFTTTATYRRELWDATGHFPHLEHPARAATTIANWLSEN